MNNPIKVRSPLFYVGDKYKLMPQLLKLFPTNIHHYYDVFCGGGSASMNINANKIIMNDINPQIIAIHKFLQSKSNNIDLFIEEMHLIIKKYGLSLSELEVNEEIKKLKLKYPKTYFAKYNKEAYLKLRSDFNNNQQQLELLYLLIIYGFNHMIRFNKKGYFNLPVGNVDWNKNVSNALKNYANWYCNNDITITSGMDFEEFVNSLKIEENDFLYFDPPYLITSSDYNKLWNESEEYRLYKLLDELNSKGVSWGLSNMYSHKGKINNILEQWSQNYYCYDIKSNYISRFDNSVKKDSRELYITNVKML